MSDAGYLVFRTSAHDATAADIERWAAERGCIVANIHEVPRGSWVTYEGQRITPTDVCHIWLADIVISEGIQG